jgi:hypothetical protein
MLRQSMTANCHPERKYEAKGLCARCYQRAYASGDKKRDRTLRYRYGITLVDYQRLYEQQQGRCALCNQSEYEADWRRLAVDHDHNTGRVRGLLCIRCNSHVAWLEAYPTFMERLTVYRSTGDTGFVGLEVI